MPTPVVPDVGLTSNSATCVDVGTTVPVQFVAVSHAEPPELDQMTWATALFTKKDSVNRNTIATADFANFDGNKHFITREFERQKSCSNVIKGLFLRYVNVNKLLCDKL